MKLKNKNNPFSITNVSAWPLKAALNQPFRIATGEHAVVENVFLSITLADGSTGFGEAAVATHITGETIEQTLQNLQSSASWLEGKAATDYLTISTHLHERLVGNHCALAALEMALLDALTRSLRLPLWRLWGSQAKPLHSDVTIVIASLEETQEKTKQFYEQGFRSFKIKIGSDHDLDVQRIQAVKKIIKKAPLLLDGNQGYSAPEAIKLIKILKRHGIGVDLFEQPVPRDDWEGLQKIGRDTGICICADESASSTETALLLMKKKMVGAINIKLMKTGLIDALEISRWARAYGIKLMIGGMVESNLAMMASAHVATALGCFDFIDLDTPFFIKKEVARNPFLSRNGIYDLSNVKAGIGIVPKKK
ncbi:MAG: dipeptide epimerase [Chthoniobacterales bacterium]|nr:dipeptide epimerase [Chthoniobacterales bacterium]